MMPSADWTQTSLWNTLSATTSEDARHVAAVIQVLTADVLKTLDAGTADPSFTLHDSDHGFRVAEWMVKIIPSEVLQKLSAYEVGLLLLSAYLHDVGMSPDGGRVQKIWNHLAFGPEKSPLLPDETKDLESWLDERGDRLQAPIFGGHVESTEQKDAVAELVAHFCRDRHNEWSKDFIVRVVAPRLPTDKYPRWADDLIQLCQSHHFGCEHLKADAFSPRQIDGRGAVVHMRYLACVLRIADILDIDPERTPDVIFKHRAIRQSSLLYWRKDHDTWITIQKKVVLLTTAPESAVIEKAVRDMGDDIHAELQLCGRLSRECPFDRAAFGKLPHKWTFPEALTLHVQPRSNAYTYIDGSFRPDTRKVLELLGGTQLYSRPIVAAREFIQNAFDAVREAIALERLARSLNGRSQNPDDLARNHEVRLRVERRDDSYWLTCTDTGVGMTRQIISNHLLVSGNSHRAQLAALERDCVRAGFALARSGQFGIGALSYFMLSDWVEIVTRRTPMHGEVVEEPGLKFTTSGPGSFGELRATSPTAVGTEVSLRLRSAVVRDPKAFAIELSGFIKTTFVRVPCRLVLSAPFASGGLDLEFKPGWTTSLSEIREQILRSIFPYEHDARLQPSAVVAERKRRNEAAEALAKVADAQLQFEVAEEQFPSNLGEVRIVMPYFDIEASRSIAWVCGRDVRFCKGSTVTSCGGASVNTFAWRRPSSPSRVEISFEDRRCGEVGVTRESMTLSNVGNQAVYSANRWFSEQEASLWLNGTSKYHELNRRIFSIPSEVAQAPHWYHSESDDWRPVRTPAIATEQIEADLVQGNRWVARWKNDGLFVGETMPWPHSKDFEIGLGLIPPDRVVLASVFPPEAIRSEPTLQIAGLYFSDIGLAPRKGSLLLPQGYEQASLFPSDWGCVVGADLGATGVFWNSSHPCSRIAHVHEIGQMTRGRANDEDAHLIPIFPEFRKLRERLYEPELESQVLAFFMKSLLDGADNWLALRERDPQFADELWNATSRFRLGVQQTFILAERRSVVVLSKEGLKRLSWTEALGTHLVKPTPEWTIEVRQEPMKL